MFMKGQATVEYLILFSIGLVLIGFSLSALAVLSDTEASLTALEMGRISAGSLKGAGDEVCALGDGNSREVAFGWEAEIECAGDVMKVIVGEGSSVVSIEHCKVSCFGVEGKEFIVRNDMGKVRIED